MLQCIAASEQTAVEANYQLVLFVFVYVGIRVCAVQARHLICLSGDFFMCFSFFYPLFLNYENAHIYYK